MSHIDQEVSKKKLAHAMLPDTSIVMEASKILFSANDEIIYNHTLRSHYLAAKYAAVNSINYDAEQLALACLFHDFGLTEAYYSPEHAFVFNSSNALKGFLTEKGYAFDKIQPMMEAIDCHFEILPKWELGEVAGLLQIGAWMDVTGLRSWNLPGERRKARKEFRAKGFFLHFNGCLFHQLCSPKRALGLILPEANIPHNHYQCKSTHS